MRRPTITQHQSAPDLEQTIDRGSGVGEGGAAAAEDRHPLPALEIRCSETVVDQIAERVVAVARGLAVEIDDEASPRCSGQTERADVVENGVTGSDCEHPVDHVSMSHAPERTKPGKAWEDLDNRVRVP